MKLAIVTQPSLEAAAGLVVKFRFPSIFFVGIPAAVGFLLGWMGAGESSHWPKSAAVTVWIVICMGGWLAAHMGTSLMARLLAPRGWPLIAVLALGVISSGVVAVPFNFLVGELFAQAGFKTRGFEALANYSAAQALDALVGPLLLWTAINLIVFSVRDEPHYGFKRSGAPVHSTPALLVERRSEPEFMKRVRLELRGEVLALQAELHYVRVFTTAGDDLILYRFSDAVEEMADAGMQVHRSWWVSREALVGGAMSPRPHLLLSNGSKVPVSRSRIQECRAFLSSRPASFPPRRAAVSPGHRSLACG
jgi:hypothetical protein